MDAKEVAEPRVEAVLANICLDAGFIAEDGSIDGLEIDMVEFLDFENV